MPPNRKILMALIVWIAAPPGIRAFEDWPQWRGPDRTGVSKETGLLGEWPEGGPNLAWQTSGLGEGYGTVSIQGNFIYVQGTRGDKSMVFCRRRADGAPIWDAELGPMLRDGTGNGPRATPTIEGGRLFAMSGLGELVCMRTDDGTVLWRKNMFQDFKTTHLGWGISESPLIDGSNVIVTPGGPGAGIVALNKYSGRTQWTSTRLSDQAGYASCIAGQVGSTRVIMTLTSKAGVGVRASDGQLLWTYETPANDTANCATPIFHDNKVFYTSDYGTGGGLLALSPHGDAVREKEVYFNKVMMNHHGGVVLVDGYLYGFSGNALTCMNFETGERMWPKKARSVGKGSLTYADGRLYLLGESNVVGLAEATPEGYRERGRFEIEDQGRPSWAHPVVCGGKLYIRNQGVLLCYDVSARGS